MSLSWTVHRARVAGLSRDRLPDDPDLLDAKAELKAAVLAEHIRKVVASAPPFTAAQRDRLAALLAPVVSR